jgi:hypothetical protein
MKECATHHITNDHKIIESEERREGKKVFFARID